MATESTLLIVKPDGVSRGLVGEVLRRVETKGLTIEELKLFTIPRATAEQHYAEHRRQAVLRRVGRLHHQRSGGGGQDHGRRRHRLLAHDHGAHEPRRCAPRLHPRRLRHADRREHRPRLGLPGVRGPRADPLLRVGRRRAGAERGLRAHRRRPRTPPSAHACGRRGAGRDRPRGDPGRRGARRGGCRRRHAGAPRDPVRDRLHLEVVRGDRGAAGGRGRPARPARERQRAVAVARAPRALRTHHAASSAHPHVGSRDRHRGVADRAGRRVEATVAAAHVRSGGALLVLQRRLQAGRAGAGAGDRHADPRAAPRAPARSAGHDVLGRRHHGRGARRPGHRLRPDVHRPAGPGHPPARSGRLDPLQLGGRQHRVQRAGHERVRAPAAGGRRRPGRTRRPDPLRPPRSSE